MAEQMTMEQVRNWHRSMEKEHKHLHQISDAHKAAADAIDAHLNAAKGEAVAGLWIGEGSEYCNHGYSDRPAIKNLPPGNYLLYIHPISPDVVRDAMQFVPEEARPELCAPISHEWLAKVTGHREGWNACRKEMLKRIDAAMAAREGGE